MTSSRMRFLALLALLCTQQAFAHPDAEGQKPEEDGDRELKTNEEGYDFFSIDQLFMNNPQYAKLLSDLQAHSFGSNWRRKRDAGEDVVDVQELREEQPNREDDIEETAPEVAAESREETATTAAIAEITEVMRDTKEQSQETQESEGRTTPLKTASPSSTTAAVASSSSLPSSTTASASFGFSGSTEATRGRPEEPTTSASPIRSSTPRRLLHKGGNKNKNKQGGGGGNKNKQDSVTAQNVNKFTVTNTPTISAASTPSQVTASVSPNSQATSSSSSVSTSSNMADAAAAVAASTAGNATAAGNKDKVSRLWVCVWEGY